MATFKDIFNLVYTRETMSKKYFLTSLHLCCTDIIKSLDDDLLKVASIVDSINTYCVLWNHRVLSQCPFCQSPIVATFSDSGKSITADFTKERVYGSR